MAATISSASSSMSTFKLLYHPQIPGRGEFVRLLFEVTRTPFKDLDYSPTDPSQEQLDILSKATSPHFAPPILYHCHARENSEVTHVVLSQTPNILAYLGQQLGLSPPQNDEGFWTVNQLALTALDGLSNETHDTHHPIGVSLYYENQRAEAKRRAKDYREGRLPKFLAYFEKVLGNDAGDDAGAEQSNSTKVNNDGQAKKWLYGNNMTYADLVLWQCLEGNNFAFPRTMESLKGNGKFERVLALWRRVGEIEEVKAYVKSGRRRDFGQGIYRRYEELDADFV